MVSLKPKVLLQNMFLYDQNKLSKLQRMFSLCGKPVWWTGKKHLLWMSMGLPVESKLWFSGGYCCHSLLSDFMTNGSPCQAMLEWSSAGIRLASAFLRDCSLVPVLPFPGSLGFCTGFLCQILGLVQPWVSLTSQSLALHVMCRPLSLFLTLSLLKTLGVASQVTNSLNG